jgi:hypothetical protein
MDFCKQILQVLISWDLTQINKVKTINWLSSLPGFLTKLNLYFSEVSTISYVFYNLKGIFGTAQRPNLSELVAYGRCQAEKLRWPMAGNGAMRGAADDG